jgi:hypothetical protein
VKTSEYYKLKDAQELIKIYSSWVGKKAHAGNGLLETLKGIVIKEKRRISANPANEKNYLVIFEFENKKKFPADEFLKINSLNARIGQNY